LNKLTETISAIDKIIHRDVRRGIGRLYHQLVKTIVVRSFKTNGFL